MAHDVEVARTKRSARSLGNASLFCSFLGFVAIEVAMAKGWLAGTGWIILARTLEAATVGGVADLFAVRALFHEVPLPVIRRHTNIIVSNRVRIVSGIVDMVQNRWISPSVIREHLSRFSASRWVLEYLSDESKQEAALSVIRDLLHQAVRGMDGPEVASFLDHALKDQLKELDIAEPLGRWLGGAIRAGKHGQAWDVVLSRLEAATRTEELKKVAMGIIRKAVDEYSEGGWVRELVVKGAQVLDVVNEEDAADALLNKLREVVLAAKDDSSHPLRRKLDKLLMDFADDLAAGKTEAVEMVEKLRRALMEGADAREIIGGMLSRLRGTLESELDTPGSELDQLMMRILRERLEAFRDDPVQQGHVDAWVRDTAISLVDKRHKKIGEMVQSSLDKLSDLDLVAQIEDKVGDDLQYIRLNGAIVGGLVGAIITTVRVLI
jgi:uncharacterized membrane-anchored protein YjiN (DUF445 family)